MAHNEHNKPRRSGGFFLIILGALLFIVSPTYFHDDPGTGTAFIIFGFIIGGIGFYLNFVKNRRVKR